MRTLFAKLLLWFIATAMLSMTAVLVLAMLTPDEDDERRPVIAALLDLQFADAKLAYEIGGRAALAAHLERFRLMTQTEAILTDSRGRDLLSGQDRADLLSELRDARERRRGFLIRRTRPFMARADRAGNYYYFVMAPRRAAFRWLFQPEHVTAVLAVILVLCWVFARHITRPVRQLQLAADCFGRGELQQRVPIDRRDELGQLARTFNEMADRIALLVAAERRLLGDISHELRSPLARLAVAVELARTSEQPAAHFDRIEKEAERLNSLVGQLLQVTRAEGDPSQLRAEAVPLAELVEDVVEDSRIEAAARGCGIVFSAADPKHVRGDPELLRRAVENLVRNAVRYEPERSDIEVRVEGSSVTVRDHGPGVPADALPRIFQPFYRVETDRDRSSGGVGLGLAIAKRAVELHKGRISARNAEPGLEVRIELP